MKVNEKPKYSIWQNVCFMVQTAWRTHKRVLLMCLVIAVVQVGLNLAQLYVTPEILEKVEQGASVKELLVTIGIFSAALFFLMGAKDYLISNRLPAEVDVRSAVIRLITRKTCETSYPNTRDPKVLKMKKQADAATNNNREATEHIWTTLTEILTNVAGFAIYLLLLTNMNVFLILVIVVTSVIGFFVSKRIREWEYRHREEMEGHYKELGYFLEKPKHLAFAKDVRIFGLGSWLRELQSKSLRMLTAFIVRREKVYIWANVVDVVMTLLRNGIAYAYLIWQTLEQGLPASVFLLYFTAVSGFSTWVTGILSEFSKLHKESIALSRVQEYLNIPEPFKFEDGKEPPKANDYELKLENVTFRYPGTEKNILEINILLD